jgi:hypothetical protein
MTPFEAYRTYLALKTHFSNPKYDFVRYGGKMKVTVESLEKRRDKYWFHKLSKHKDPVGLIVSNYIATDNIPWVGKLVGSKEAENNYIEWMAKTQKLSYTFGNEIKLLDEDFNKNFEVTENQYPPLLIMYNKKKISIETMVILDKLLNFTSVWEKKIQETTYFPVVKLKIVKYSSFLKFDKNIFKDKLLSHFQKV